MQIKPNTALAYMLCMVNREKWASYSQNTNLLGLVLQGTGKIFENVKYCNENVNVQPEKWLKQYIK